MFSPKPAGSVDRAYRDLSRRAQLRGLAQQRHQQCDAREVAGLGRRDQIQRDLPGHRHQTEADGGDGPAADLAGGGGRLGVKARAAVDRRVGQQPGRQNEGEVLGRVAASLARS